MNENKNYAESINTIKIPVLILDQKWHQLFRVCGKTVEIKEKEQELNLLLQKQGQLNREIKELKKLKGTLMDNIVQNMDGTTEENCNEIVAKKLEEDRRLIDEINEKLENHEDQLLEIPRAINDCNKELMLLTMDFCYNSFRTNADEIQEISAWIKQVRHDLKVNIVKKQNREINSKQIYAYMHDIFGANVIDLFDLKNEDVTLDFKEQDAKEDTKES